MVNRAPRTPSFGGYVGAVAISLLLLSVEMGVVSAVQDHTGFTAVGVTLLVLAIGLLPAAVIGGIGAIIVHFATRNASAQWPAVVAAGAVGLASGFALYQGTAIAFTISLGATAAMGRAAVAPCSRSRGGTARVDPVAYARLIERDKRPLDRDN